MTAMAKRTNKSAAVNGVTGRAKRAAGKATPADTPAVRRAAAKKVSKKKAKRKTSGPAGKTRPARGKRAAQVADAGPGEAVSPLSAAVREIEQALERASERLADARERVAHAGTTARTKRTPSAYAAADRAREAIALINESRIEVTARLMAARDALKEPSGAAPDVKALEAALRDALARYEAFLAAFDRRVARSRRGGDRRKA